MALGQAPLVAGLVIILVVAALIRRLPSITRRTPLVPGPPGDPLIGHVRFMPTVHSWLYYTELQKKYGAYPLTLCRMISDVAHRSLPPHMGS